MSLIIKDALPKFKKGYPTVSDKYDVAGAVLSGTSPLYFGQMVKAATTKGYFAAVDATQTIAAVTDIKGICLATNVKLNEAYGGDDVKTVPGEAFNLMIRGFMAIELAATATAAEVVANAAVYATAAGGFTTASDATALKSGATAAPIPNMVFTGEIENIGTTSAPKYLAEIYIK